MSQDGNSAIKVKKFHIDYHFSRNHLILLWLAADPVIVNVKGKVAECGGDFAEVKTKKKWSVVLKDGIVSFLDYMLLPWEGPVLGLRMFRSQQAVRKEIRRQKLINRFLIHSLSRFRWVWFQNYMYTVFLRYTFQVACFIFTVTFHFKFV